MKLNAFNYGGNCEQALRFYEQHLDGKITVLMRRAEQPDQPATWKKHSSRTGSDSCATGSRRRG